MLVIKGGKVVTMANKLLDGGDILVENGKIKEIGEEIKYTPQRTDEVIDASDCFVFPGFIDAHCHLGIVDDGIGDMFVPGNPMKPAVSALYGVDYDASGFYECVKSGITSVMVTPPGRQIVGGRCAMIKTAKPMRRWGGVKEQKHNILSDFSAMRFALTGIGAASTPEQAALIVSMLRDELNAAVSYMREHEQARENDKYFFTSPTLENYIPLFKKELPAFVSVTTAEEIRAAVRVFKKFEMDVVLVGCDACDDLGDETLNELAESGFSVVFGSGIANSGRGFKLLLQLVDRGVPSALSTVGPDANIQYLPIFAGIATREGVSMEKVLNAITLSPAEICRFSHRIGSLEQGKDADIVIFDANPLEVFTKTLFTIVDGDIVYRA